jgi:hypothetical protein
MYHGLTTQGCVHLYPPPWQPTPSSEIKHATHIFLV